MQQPIVRSDISVGGIHQSVMVVGPVMHIMALLDCGAIFVLNASAASMLMLS